MRCIAAGLKSLDLPVLLLTLIFEYDLCGSKAYSERLEPIVVWKAFRLVKQRCGWTLPAKEIGLLQTLRDKMQERAEQKKKENWDKAIGALQTFLQSDGAKQRFSVQLTRTQALALYRVAHRLRITCNIDADAIVFSMNET